MDPKEYLRGVLKTESTDSKAIFKRVNNKIMRLLHAGTGMATEAGEVVDVLKKHIFYGKPIDRLGLIDEVGDLLWYIGLALDELGSSFEEAMEANNRKLSARYGEKFSENAALNRDTDREREALKGKVVLGASMECETTEKGEKDR